MRLCAPVAALAIFTLAGCIENDIPYPRIQPNITEFEVAGQLRAADIDSAMRTVSVTLNDSVDINSLTLRRFAITHGARMADTAIVLSPLNLSQPLELTLSIYQDYIWTVSATQNIDRWFTVVSQVGASVIDAENHTVTVTVPVSTPLDAVTVLSARLGTAVSVIEPDVAGKTIDCTNPVNLTVSQFGRTEQWTLTVKQTELNVDITSVDAWTNVAWVNATVQSGKKATFEYRRSGATVWTAVPEAWISLDGGIITVRLTHLDADSRYEVRGYCDGQYTPETMFNTGTAAQPENPQLTQWWLDGKIWCPWAQGGTPYWGTGNKGATTLGDSNTTPLKDAGSSTGYAGASLETRFVGIGMLGKLAAGNLFSGDYVRTEGTNGILSFGRPFGQRPTALKARVRYTTAPISHSGTEFAYLKGQPDTCVVWCALTDGVDPVEIRTKPANRKLFDADDPDVIAYGCYQSGDSDSDYIDITVPLDYRSTSRVPRWILIVASASKYGDYFTGGAGALLLVRDFELVYDYPTE